MRRDYPRACTHVMHKANMSTLHESHREPARPAWGTMDDDGEEDSLSELPPSSRSCWMMKNLLHQETVPSERLSLSLPDTVLLQDGHIFHWLFTSSKSGSVVKVCTSFYDTSFRVPRMVGFRSKAAVQGASGDNPTIPRRTRTGAVCFVVCSVNGSINVESTAVGCDEGRSLILPGQSYVEQVIPTRFAWMEQKR